MSFQVRDLLDCLDWNMNEALVSGPSAYSLTHLTGHTPCSAYNIFRNNDYQHQTANF